MSVAVASGKGGTGCTALALNLAAALSAHGAVLVVDADAPPFGTLSVAGDLDPGETVAWMARQRFPIEPRVLRHAATPHAAGFAVLALWTDPDDAAEVEGVVPAVLDACAAAASFVVVDVGRPVLPAQRALVRRTSLALALATLDLAALRNLRQLIDTLAVEGAGGALPMLVLNRSSRDASYGVDQAAAALGRPFTATLPYAETMRAHLDRGELLAAVDPQHAWSVAVRRLAEAMVARRRDTLRSALGDGGAAASAPNDG
jgi:pilus assembly protein CpaE